jgi:hypothetical protein
MASKSNRGVPSDCLMSLSDAAGVMIATMAVLLDLLSMYMSENRGLLAYIGSSTSGDTVDPNLPDMMWNKASH